MRASFKAAALVLALFAGVAPVDAQTQNTSTTDVVLVLAVDPSGSVNQTRFELQRKGYADAFRSPQVVNAIRGLSTGSIAVSIPDRRACTHARDSAVARRGSVTLASRRNRLVEHDSTHHGGDMKKLSDSAPTNLTTRTIDAIDRTHARVAMRLHD